MMDRVLCCCLLLALCTKLTSSLSPQVLRFPRIKNQLELPFTQVEDGNNYTRYYTQKLDHFDATSTATWQQRWFVNDEFFKQGSPVFLCVGGEGPALSPAVVTKHNIHCSNMVSLAQTYSALVVAVEHRFYGDSMPIPDFKTSSLRFLSSKQAISDIALLHSHISKLYNLNRNNLWISFGGSYPGMLASFLRIKFPHLFWGAVASSAPVQAIANYRGYNDVVAYSLSATDVGGSPKCLATVKEAFAKVGELLKTKDGQRTLEGAFNICTKGALASQDNQRLFAEFLTMHFSLQGNDPACTSKLCNIAKTCKAIITHSGSAFDSLVNLTKKSDGISCIDIDYNKELRELTDTKYIPGQNVRSWLYQTCTEFGFYQTCDPDSNCPFVTDPHLETLQSNFDLCNKMFGIPPSTVKSSIEFSNMYYGGDNPGASRILYVNGEVDPWRAASVKGTLCGDIVSFMVKGASHHFWTHPAKSTDSAQVVLARERIAATVATWLKDAQVSYLSSSSESYNKRY